MVTEAQKQPITEENIIKQISKLGDTCFEAEQVQVYTDGKAFYSLKALNELRRQAVIELEEQIITGNGLALRREVAMKIEDLKPAEENKKINKEKQCKILIWR